jgi:hypothetical protein
VELVPEAAKGAFALDGPCQPAPGAFIGDGFGEVGHVLIPDPGWQRIDADQVQLVEVDRCLAVDAGVGLVGQRVAIEDVRREAVVVFDETRPATGIDSGQRWVSNRVVTKA